MRAVRSTRRRIAIKKIRLLGLKNHFVAKTADAHSMTKMRGLFEPNSAPESRPFANKGAGPGNFRSSRPALLGGSLYVQGLPRYLNLTVSLTCGTLDNTP